MPMFISLEILFLKSDLRKKGWGNQRRMKRDLLVLDCPEIRCPPVLLLVFKEALEALERRGYRLRMIDSIGDITENALVFMGNFVKVEDPGSLLRKQSDKAIYFGWYWQQWDTEGLQFIYMYENVLSPTLLPDKVEVLKFMNARPNTCPLLLRANEPVENIGKLERVEEYDYCFMGGKMCTWLLPHGNEFRGSYHGTHNITEYLSYDHRREIYLKTRFALGFQTNDNITNGHVSQRIFEGMAYGCVVLSNSMPAVEQTEGIVEYVCSHEQVEEKMRYFLQHPEERRQKQERGYEFVRKTGTNEYSISKLLNTVKRVYGIDIDMD